VSPLPPPRVTVSADVSAVAAVGVLAFGSLAVAERGAALAAAIAEATAALRAAPAAGDAFEATRAMYRGFGIDPTRRRPSSEALLRRIGRGGDLPRINTLVDVCNWCSVEVQLPYGLYDLDRVDGDVEVRLASTSAVGRWWPIAWARSATPPPIRPGRWSRPPRRVR